MNATLSLNLLLALAVAMWQSPAATGQEKNVVNQFNTASQLVMDGQSADALDQFDRLESQIADHAQLAYNRGVAYYRNGDLEQSRQMFAAALDTTDANMAARAGFNLGNCFYSSALQQRETDPAAAIISLDSAIDHYRNALRCDTADFDARANIELAAQLKRDLQDQQQDQQQQDQQQQDQQPQDQQPQDQQPQDQQPQDQQPQDQQPQDQQPQDQQPQDQQPQDQQPQDQQQQDQQPQDQQPQDQQPQDQQPQDQQPQDQQPQDQQPQDQQQQDQQQQDHAQSAESSSPESADDSSRNPEPANDTPSGELNQDDRPPSPDNRSVSPERDQPIDPQPAPDESETQPSDEAKENNPPPAGQLQANSQNQTEEPGVAMAAAANPEHGEMGEEEAMKMLQAIRDRDLQRRMRNLDRKLRNHVPVDRDW